MTPNPRAALNIMLLVVTFLFNTNPTTQQLQANQIAILCYQCQ